jgi:hypothetical protein
MLLSPVGDVKELMSCRNRSNRRSRIESFGLLCNILRLNLNAGLKLLRLPLLAAQAGLDRDLKAGIRLNLFRLLSGG